MIIGLSGQKQSGKSTLGNLLAEKYGLLHTSFAAPMREFVAKLVGCDVVQLEEIKETPIAWLNGRTPRHMLQTLGTEWGREMVSSQLWVLVAMRKALLSGRAILSDVRFANEATAIRAAGGVVIRIARDNACQPDSHTSERPLQETMIDFELRNNGTPEELLDAAERVIFGPNGCAMLQSVELSRGEDAAQGNAATDADVAAYAAPGTPATVQVGD